MLPGGLRERDRLGADDPFADERPLIGAQTLGKPVGVSLVGHDILR
jgi:hypothetical protein